MRTRFWAAFAALAILVTAHTARADENALAQTRRQTFVVQVCSDARHAVAIGSGVVVAREGGILTLATAAHIVLLSGALRILDASRQSYYDVLQVRTLPDYDLAFVRVRAQRQFPVAPANLASPVAGQSVWIWGHTGDGFWELATGVVRETSAKIAGLPGSPRITIDCAKCSQGDSGSGVFDDQGHLLGVLTRAWSNKGGGPVLFIEVEPAAIISRQVVVNR